MRALNVKSQPDLGMRLETMVFIHLKQRHDEIYYLKSSHFDVDFVIKEQFKITELIQVCYDLSKEKTKTREVKSLIAAAIELKVSSLKIITRDDTDIISIEGFKIQVIPVWQYLVDIHSEN
jgi:predicted AAA+ superfamily ATPase